MPRGSKKEKAETADVAITKKASQEAAQTSATLAGLTPVTHVGDDIAPAPKADERSLLTAACILSRPILNLYKKESEVKELIALVRDYEGIAAATKIPEDTGANFIKNLGSANKTMLTAHTALLEQTTMASEEYFASANESHMIFEKSTKRKAVALAGEFAYIAGLLQTQLIGLQKIYDDVATAKAAGDGALEGIAGKSYKEAYEAVQVFRFNPNQAEELGQGGINTVQKVQFQGANRVFKRGKVHVRAQKEYLDEQYEGIELEVLNDRMKYEIDKQIAPYGTGAQNKGVKNANMAQRDVAVSRINKLFGLDIVVNTQLAKSEQGETSSLMDLGGGRSVDDMFLHAGEETQAEAIDVGKRKTVAEIESLKKQCITATSSLVPLEEKTRSGEILSESESSQKYEMEQEIRENSAKIKKLRRRKSSAGAKDVVDITDHRVVMQIFKLSVLDIICGHVDRHIGNYMAQKDDRGEVRITGIDNDTSFGLNTDVEEVTKSMLGTECHAKLKEAFPFVPQEIKDKVMSKSEGDIQEALVGLLSDPQIKASCDRFNKMKSYFERLEAEDISAQNTKKLLGMSHRGNYIANMRLEMETAKKKYGERPLEETQEGVLPVANPPVASTGSQQPTWAIARPQSPRSAIPAVPVGTAATRQAPPQRPLMAMPRMPQQVVAARAERPTSGTGREAMLERIRRFEPHK